jgi:glycosyltransferase 2 family protein
MLRFVESFVAGARMSAAGSFVGRVGRRIRVVQLAVGAILLAAMVLATARNWSDVKETIASLSPIALVVSLLLALCGLFASVLTWRRSVRELGTRVSVHDASRIYLVGQLAKYIPGSVWAVALQMQLGKQAGLRRSRGFTAALVAIGVNCVTSLALGLLALSAVGDESGWAYLAILVSLPLGLVLVTPPLLTREIDVVLRLMRRPALERPVSWRGVAVASGWSLTTWLCYGLALYALVVSAGGDAGESLALCLGGVPLAMTAGFVIVVAPSGIAIREAVLVAALAPVLPASSALALALVLRVCFTAADALAAAAAVAKPRSMSRRLVARPATAVSRAGSRAIGLVLGSSRTTP